MTYNGITYYYVTNLQGDVVVGSATTYITAFGATDTQTFALGALTYDIWALVIAPFLGIELEPIEYAP